MRSRRPAIGQQTRPRTLVGALSSAALLVSLAALAVNAGGCGSCTTTGGDVTRVMPAEASGGIVVSELGGLREDSVAFLAGIEGTSGLLELVEARYGVDLSEPDGLSEAGIDADAGLAVFADGDFIGVAVGVSDAERFLELVRERANRGAGAIMRDVEGAEKLLAGDSPAALEGGVVGLDWNLAAGVTSDHIGMLLVGPPGGDPVARWQQLDSGSGGFAATGPATLARGDGGEGAVAWGAGRLALPIPEAVPALVTPYLEGLRDWTGNLSMDPNRFGLSLKATWGGAEPLPVGWVNGTREQGDFAELFPRSTTALLRGRVDVARIRAIPSFLRTTFMPKRLPDIDGLLAPPPNDLIEALDGDYAVALLGVDADVTISALQDPRQRTTAALQLLHLAVAVRLLEPDDGPRLAKAIATSATTMNTDLETRLSDARAKKTKMTQARWDNLKARWTVADISGGGWTGHTMVRKERSYHVITKGNFLVFLTGSGEVERFIAVSEGTAMNLRSASEDPAVIDALVSADKTFGLYISFTRITRELADKGVPPYFLKVINTIRFITVSIAASAGEVSIDLDVKQ